jgi:uncharacterized protein YjbI with pentapeptide repeats
MNDVATTNNTGRHLNKHSAITRQIEPLENLSGAKMKKAALSLVVAVVLLAGCSSSGSIKLVNGYKFITFEDYKGDEIQERANLRDADLRGAKLPVGVYLREADLTNANLRDADLTRAHLFDADLTGANLAGANLAGANLTGANLTDADLTGANMLHTKLVGADLSRAILLNADLANAILGNATLTGANLHFANMNNANLAGANLTGANLTGADLFATDLSRAILLNADLAYADLYLAKNANLRGANLRGTTMPNGSEWRIPTPSVTVIPRTQSPRYEGGDDKLYIEDDGEDYEPCYGDCNDMDNDGRTWDDYDADGDGRYETR